MSAKSNAADASQKSGMLGLIEKIGNMVPHPVIIFLGLIVIVIVLSHIMYLTGVSATSLVEVPVAVDLEQTQVGGSTGLIYATPDEAPPPAFEIKEETFAIKSLLTVEGIRFIFTSFVNNFANFSVVAVIFVAMIGVGVAEEAGLMAALIRKLVASAPAWALTFIIVFIGALSSVATDAGYLILIPLGAAAFLSVGRHPLAGIAAAYAGVSAYFAVNILIAPLDALLTEMTNEAIQLATPGQSITIVSNYYFSVAFTIIMSVICTVVTARLIEPRLGKYDKSKASTEKSQEEEKVDLAAEARGLKFSLYGLVGTVALILLLTLPEGAPLRHPETGAVIGFSPFMDSLIFMISMLFLVIGVCYGIGAGTIKNSVSVVNGVVKTFAGLAGLVFMLLVISQFIAYFNYSQMPNVIAVTLARVLEQAGLGPIPLLIGMILVIIMLDIIIPGSLPKWAIFAPIFVPLFIRLGVAPQTVLAAYRIGDSPMNVITPLMVYLPFIVFVGQRYVKDTGIGTIIALMIPYTVVVAVSWIVLFIIWFVLGIPLGPGYPVNVP